MTERATVGWLLVGLGALALLLWPRRARAAQAGGAEAFGPRPYTEPVSHGVPFAGGVSQPLWPLEGGDRVVAYRDVYGGQNGLAARSFGAPRESTSRPEAGRYHAGIDLYAPEGTPVVATEPGRVVRTYIFTGDTWAVVVQGDSGLVQLYGELSEPAVGRGDRVGRGDLVGHVGRLPGGSTLLHFETYAEGTTANERWYRDAPAPLGLRDPTAYLLRALWGE